MDWPTAEEFSVMQDYVETFYKVIKGDTKHPSFYRNSNQNRVLDRKQLQFQENWTDTPFPVFIIIIFHAETIEGIFMPYHSIIAVQPLKFRKIFVPW